MNPQQKRNESRQRMLKLEKKVIEMLDKIGDIDRKLTLREIRYVFLQILSKIDLDDLEANYNHKEKPDLIIPNKTN